MVKNINDIFKNIELEGVFKDAHEEAVEELGLTDEQALENLEVVNTSNARYEKKAIVTLDTISKNFTAGSIVTLELLKKKKIVNPKTDYVRILARGSIDKPLIIEAQDFTTDAIKMLILTGGQAHKVA